MNSQDKIDDNINNIIQAMKLFGFLQRQTSNEHHIIYSNNDEYHGEMKDNMKHGKGVYKFANGNRYEGEWLFNQKHGTGKYFYNSGELYIGQWQQNKKNGHGQHFGVYGDRYVGQWVNNCKHGRGTIYYAENSIYSGEFSDNKKHGPGYFYNSSTRELTYQLYDNDKLKEQKVVDQVPCEFENVFSAVLVKDNQIIHPQPLPNTQVEETHQIQQEAHGFDTLQAMNETVTVKGKKKMQDWNIEEVCIWLDCLGLSQYKENFIKNHMIGDTLHDLTDVELKEELGIEILGHRKLILQQINMHKKYYIKKMAGQLHRADSENSADQSSKYDQLYSIIQKIEPAVESPGIEVLKQKKSRRKRSSGSEDKLISPEQKEQQQETAKFSPKQGNQGQSLKVESKQVVSNFNINNATGSESSDESSSSSNEKPQELQLESNQSSSPSKHCILSEKNLQQKHQEKLMSLLQDLGINEKLLINYQEIKQGPQIGKGSYGIVFKGNWLGQDVAIKSYCKKKEQQKHKQLMADFLKEVQVISNLRHPNIVLYMGVCIKRHNFYLITEYMENGSLYDHIHKKKTKNLNFIQIIEDITLGMNNLHGRRIMHCDLKSSNVLIDQNWNVKLCDFGLSRIKSKKTKSMIGTPHWMAPEIMRGEPYTEKSDVYSFGMILWEIITGKIPYENLSITQIIGTVGWGHTQVEIPQFSNPPILAILAKDCLKREPSQRPTFAKILEKIQESQKQECKNKEKAKKFLIDFLSN
ncbi:unnamed protein product (macronuclear) [Paramecium tetraurelia]|uniref:non-specific serine/threonine protein kinase n=1 Tax=Paramecium tetraurelia TaxID=5888 RepID=A0CL90_PARTE|nr:uncharacterized protein GSPATT00008104001 [Paramecium tetraurelia]CAK71557.1 unnamed protein product [Paramecium tetraurelia]|eukprot:XP_001438954.1 hypothetical protein (macronuclear) [Paramecium tetraurelia strain d4-2]